MSPKWDDIAQKILRLIFKESYGTQESLDKMAGIYLLHCGCYLMGSYHAVPVNVKSFQGIEGELFCHVKLGEAK